MMKSNKLIIALSSILILASCAKEKSSSTGWEYNNSRNGGFETNNKFQFSFIFSFNLYFS